MKKTLHATSKDRLLLSTCRFLDRQVNYASKDSLKEPLNDNFQIPFDRFTKRQPLTFFSAI